jgi:osmotically inducible protein OsmC
MPTRQSEAEWSGDLKQGKGTMKLGSGAFQGNYSFTSRMENGPGTNPEELIAAAHAGCYSMALSAILSAAGHVPTKVHTTAHVHFGPVPDGFAITQIELNSTATVPGLDQATFNQFAQQAKSGCPVSKALASVPITLTAKLT